MHAQKPRPAFFLGIEYPDLPLVERLARGGCDRSGEYASYALAGLIFIAIASAIYIVMCVWR